MASDVIGGLRCLGRHNTCQEQGGDKSTKIGAHRQDPVARIGAAKTKVTLSGHSFRQTWTLAFTVKDQFPKVTAIDGFRERMPTGVGFGRSATSRHWLKSMQYS